MSSPRANPLIVITFLVKLPYPLLSVGFLSALTCSFSCFQEVVLDEAGSPFLASSYFAPSSILSLLGQVGFLDRYIWPIRFTRQPGFTFIYYSLGADWGTIFIYRCHGHSFSEREPLTALVTELDWYFGNVYAILILLPFVNRWSYVNFSLEKYNIIFPAYEQGGYIQNVSSIGAFYPSGYSFFQRVPTIYTGGYSSFTRLSADVSICYCQQSSRLI